MKRSICAFGLSAVIILLAACTKAVPAPEDIPSVTATAAVSADTAETSLTSQSTMAATVKTESHTVCTTTTEIGSTPSKSRITIPKKGTTTTGKTLRQKNVEWRSHPEDYRLIAMTFDGEPNSSEAGKYNRLVEMVDVLYEYGGAGTIDVMGSFLQENGPALLQYALDRGFEMACYAWEAEFMENMTVEQIRTTVNRTCQLVENRLHVKPVCVRPPYLSTGDKALETIGNMGYYLIGGNYNSHKDGWYVLEDGLPSVQKQNMLKNAHDGAIWIVHAASNLTPEAVTEAVPELYAKGYRFCTVSELFRYKGITPKPGTLYNEVG